MAYFSRKENRKNGIYLQMYENYWDKELKQGRSKHVCSFGFVHDLIFDNIPDHIEHYTEIVSLKEVERKELLNDDTQPRAFEE